MEDPASHGGPRDDAYAFVVPPDADGQRLDRFLVSTLAGHSRAQIQKLIVDGEVELTRTSRRARLDSSGLRSNATVHEGDTVHVHVPAAVESSVDAEDLPIEILFEDEDVAVLNKPAGMVVHPSAGHGGGTLVNALLHHLTDLSGVGGERRPGIVHRLDRGTSGVMVVAKNDAAHHELARQFHDREVEKEYLALVWGVVQAGRRIDAAIGRDSANRQKMSARTKHARSAVTRITRAHHLPGLSLCQVAIHTGRTHQIRVHLSAIGHPVVGDSLYGGVHRRVPGDIRAVQRLDRPFLHAMRLAFTHPRDGRRLELIAPLPEDLQRVLEDLPGWPPEARDAAGRKPPPTRGRR